MSRWNTTYAWRNGGFHTAWVFNYGCSGRKMLPF